MTVREMQVPVLELRGRRQQDVRVVGGVGLEVLEHDGEQIVAPQAFEHDVAIRRNGRGIRVVHDHRAHRRAADAGVFRRQRFAQANHVDRAHRRRQIGALHRRRIEREVRARRQLHSAAGPAPMPGQRGQAGDGAHGHPAAGVPLQSVVHANERRLRASVSLAERDDDFRRDAGDARDSLRRILARALAQRVESHGVARDVVVVLQSALEDDVHHPQRQRRVGAGLNADPFVALRRGARLNRVDGDDRRAARLRLEHERPQVGIRRERVRAPQQHEVALGDPLGVRPDVRAQRHAHADGAGHGADRSVEHRRADGMEEPAVDRRSLHDPHRAGVRIRKDRLRAVARTSNVVQARRDLVERLVPRNPRKFS